MGRRVGVRLALPDTSFTYSWPSFDRNIAYFVPKSQNRNPIPTARCTFPPILTLTRFLPPLPPLPRRSSTSSVTHPLHPKTITIDA
jgi:hypothetical protein